MRVGAVCCPPPTTVVSVRPNRSLFISSLVSPSSAATTEGFTPFVRSAANTLVSTFDVSRSRMPSGSAERHPNRPNSAQVDLHCQSVSKPQIAQAVRQGHGGDLPDSLAADDLVDVCTRRHVAQDACPGHEERGREGVRPALSFGTRAGVLAAMHDQVPEFVSGVDAASYGRFQGVEEHEGGAVTPDGERVDLGVSEVKGEHFREPVPSPRRGGTAIHMCRDASRGVRMLMS